MRRLWPHKSVCKLTLSICNCELSLSVWVLATDVCSVKVASRGDGRYVDDDVELCESIQMERHASRGCWEGVAEERLSHRLVANCRCFKLIVKEFRSRCLKQLLATDWGDGEVLLRWGSLQVIAVCWLPEGLPVKVFHKLVSFFALKPNLQAVSRRVPKVGVRFRKLCSRSQRRIAYDSTLSGLCFFETLGMLWGCCKVFVCCWSVRLSRNRRHWCRHYSYLRLSCKHNV